AHRYLFYDLFAHNTFSPLLILLLYYYKCYFAFRQVVLPNFFLFLPVLHKAVHKFVDFRFVLSLCPYYHAYTTPRKQKTARPIGRAAFVK
ncbi:MAG: hypothetical protein IKA72_05445, partial [Clostridia bacterium]|nr:hypothetical protein [Clostridia bacterium]